mgnify:FL=1
MSKKFALLDMENVQPTSLQKLKNEGYHLKVFVGANQSKISVELAEEIQTFGESAQYIRIQSSGKNALDFHIAFYMGQLASTEPDSQFVIVSKDTGYDPLLKHMRNIGIKANRSSAAVGSTTTPAKPTKPTEQTTVTNKKSPTQMSLAERVAFAHKHLQKAGKAKPGKLASLAADLHSKFQKKLDEKSVQSLIKELIKQGVVIDNQGTITYQLNKKSKE